MVNSQYYKVCRMGVTICYTRYDQYAVRVPINRSVNMFQDAVRSSDLPTIDTELSLISSKGKVDSAKKVCLTV